MARLAAKAEGWSDDRIQADNLVEQGFLEPLPAP